VEIRDTRYARARDGAYIAYQTVGEGPIDFVWQVDWFSNVAVIWEMPIFARFFTGVSRFCRLILRDRRATGLSSRDVPVPNLETRVSDLQAVLEAVGSVRPVLGGEREAGAPNALLAASDPEAVRSLVWYAPTARSSWAPNYPWGGGPEYFAQERTSLALWGTEGYDKAFAAEEAFAGHELPKFAPGMFGMITRHTTTPNVAEELSRIRFEMDVREVLRSVRVPTLLIVHEGNRSLVEEARYVADLMSDARLATLAGDETTWDVPGWIEATRTFIGVDRPVELESVLSTILFTDIVGSTKRQAALGDQAWKDLVERHHALVRESLERYRGTENDMTGDGFRHLRRTRPRDPLRNRDRRTGPRDRPRRPRRDSHGRVRADRRQGRWARGHDRRSRVRPRRSVGGPRVPDREGSGRG
jgi:pimeloyl-ACP methyl ester carboxylesterase